MKRRLKKEGSNSGVKFKLDSVYFKKLKQRAIDECIHIYFEKYRLADCIELAYKMHLNHPKDEFYLYFIIESLRRTIALFPESRHAFFITSRYKFKKSNTKDLAVNRIHESIHYHLTDLYRFDSIALKKMENSSLTTIDSIEFVTNDEALSYFSKLARSGCKACVPSLYLIDTVDVKVPDTSKISDFEKGIYQNTFINKELDKKAKTTNFLFLNNYYKSMNGNRFMFIEPMYTKHEVGVHFRKFIENTGENAIKKLKQYYNPIPDLTYREYLTINALLGVVSEKLIRTNQKVKNFRAKKYIYRRNKKAIEIKFDAYYEVPELFALAKKYKLENVYFVDFVQKEADPMIVNPGTYKDRINLLLYKINFYNKTIKREYMKINFMHRNDLPLFQFLYPVFMDYFKIM